MTNTPKTQRCSNHECAEVKPLDQFPFVKSTGKYRSKCKTCTAAYDRAARARRAEADTRTGMQRIIEGVDSGRTQRNREAQAKWRAKNSDKIKATRAANSIAGWLVEYAAQTQRVDYLTRMRRQAFGKGGGFAWSSYYERELGYARLRLDPNWKKSIHTFLAEKVGDKQATAMLQQAVVDHASIRDTIIEQYEKRDERAAAEFNAQLEEWAIRRAELPADMETREQTLRVYHPDGVHLLSGLHLQLPEHPWTDPADPEWQRLQNVLMGLARAENAIRRLKLKAAGKDRLLTLEERDEIDVLMATDGET